MLQDGGEVCSFQEDVYVSTDNRNYFLKDAEISKEKGIKRSISPYILDAYLLPYMPESQ